jgi:hypothetical protein
MIDLTQPPTHRAWGKHRRRGIFVCWKDLGPVWMATDENGQHILCFDEQSLAVGHDRKYWFFPVGVTPPDPPKKDTATNATPEIED